MEEICDWWQSCGKVRTSGCFFWRWTMFNWFVDERQMKDTDNSKTLVISGFWPLRRVRPPPSLDFINRHYFQIYRNTTELRKWLERIFIFAFFISGLNYITNISLIIELIWLLLLPEIFNNCMYLEYFSCDQ